MICFDLMFLSGYAWIFPYEPPLSHLSLSYSTVCSATALSQSKDKPYSLVLSRLASTHTHAITHQHLRQHPNQTQFDPPHQGLLIDTGISLLARETSKLSLFKHTSFSPSNSADSALQLGNAEHPRAPALPFVRFRSRALKRRNIQETATHNRLID